MKTKSKLVFVIAMFITTSLVLLIISQLSSALEPGLLWKKEIPSFIWNFAFAEESGDVIFVHGDKNQITLLDKNGNTRWQWGPDLEKVTTQVDISKNGDVFVYDTSKKIIHASGTIHYSNRNVKDIWKLVDRHEIPYLSPNGKYLFLSRRQGWKGKSSFLDSNGKTLWKYATTPIGEVIFSPDGNYLAVQHYLFDISGNVCNKKLFYGFFTSVSDNGEFIGVRREKEKEGIYDREGNLIFQGRNMISGDGKIVMRFNPNKMEVFRFPEKLKLKEYPIKRWEPDLYDYEYFSKISYNGRYIAVFGERIDKESSSNLVVVDINEDKIWDGIIPEFNENDQVNLLLTNDGKYLLVVHLEETAQSRQSRFYYYQIY